MAATGGYRFCQHDSGKSGFREAFKWHMVDV